MDEIPTNKRFDTLVAIYREKLNGDIYNTGLVVRTLMSRLPEDQVKQYLAIVSEELSTITDEEEFRHNLHLLPPNLWEQLSEISRLRAENRVIRAIKEGEAVGERCLRGALATWARNHLRYFKLKDQVGMTFVEKLESDNPLSKYYIAGLFLEQLPDVVLSPYLIQRCVKAISDSIREGDEAICNSLIGNICSLPENWQKRFAEALKDLTDEDNPLMYLNDGSPFLASGQPTETESEDDLPF